MSEDFIVKQVKTSDSSKRHGWEHLVFTVYDGAPAQEISCAALTCHHLLIHKHVTPVRATIRINGEIREEWVKSGDLVLLPAGTDFSYRWENEQSFLLLALSPAFLQQLAESSSDFPEQAAQLTTHQLFRDPKLLQIASWLAEELRHTYGTRESVRSLTTLLAIHLLRHYGPNRPAYDVLPEHLNNFQLSAVIDFMHAHLEQDISLSALAHAANVSAPHLVRLFRRSTGFAPHQYLIHLRIQRAKELLIRGGLSISEVAAQTGFADQSHLTRHFKRIVGCTPRSFLMQMTF